MKRSHIVQVSLLSSVAALLTSCATRPDRYCVDERQNVVDNFNCEDPRRAVFGHHYGWYYGGARGYVSNGTHLTNGSTVMPSQGFNSSPSGTSRGGIGGAGEAAGHAGGGEGGGE